MSETVKDTVAAYRAGEMTLDELAVKIAGRSFAPIGDRPATFDQMYDEAEDRDPVAPGTWNGDVRMLVYSGDLTPEEYAAVSKAKDTAAGR